MPGMTEGSLDRMLTKMADSDVVAFNTRDILLVQAGARIRMCEYGAIDGNLGVMTGEKTLQQIKKLFRHLPADHGIGHVQIVAGEGSDCDALVKCLSKCARRSHFTATVMTPPNSQQIIFSKFFITIDRRVKAHGAISLGWTS
jgi:hypothetical protein